ncbi:MAG TPA: hypothetical protein VG013_36255 [Gemmataceae bacterium]|nr:hypothetical protein [Gemmataceae bacterium]
MIPTPAHAEPLLELELVTKEDDEPVAEAVQPPPPEANHDEGIKVARIGRTAKTAKLDEDVEAGEQEEPKKKKKKKKKKRPLPDGEPIGVPVWAWWWVGAFGALLLVVLTGVVMAMKDETAGPVLFLGFKLIIMVPVGFVVLIISFVLASKFGGGIDFGPVSMAIPKAFILLLASTLSESFDLPFFVDSAVLLVIWVVGLLVLFHLDPWETWFVIIMNWILLKAAFFAVIMFMLMVATHGGKTLQKQDDNPNQPPPIPMQQQLAPGD